MRRCGVLVVQGSKLQLTHSVLGGFLLRIDLVLWVEKKTTITMLVTCNNSHIAYCCVSEPSQCDNVNKIEKHEKQHQKAVTLSIIVSFIARTLMKLNSWISHSRARVRMRRACILRYSRTFSCTSRTARMNFSTLLALNWHKLR